MGWTAFGGPAAHVGLFNKTFVSRDDDDDDAGAPGRRGEGVDDAGRVQRTLSARAVHARTASTQMSFAIGRRSEGCSGVDERGVVSVSGVDYDDLGGDGRGGGVGESVESVASVHRGSERGGVGLVVSAADGLARSQGGKTRTTKALCATSAVVACIIDGVVVSEFNRVRWCGHRDGGAMEEEERKDGRAERRWGRRRSRRRGRRASGIETVGGRGVDAAWIVTLITLGIVVSNTSYESNKELHWFEAFWRTGSIIFGGGQVVLPLLLNERRAIRYDVLGGDAVTNACTAYAKTETATSWITEEQFFAGLGVVQAMPGPLFNLARTSAPWRETRGRQRHRRRHVLLVRSVRSGRDVNFRRVTILG